MAKKIRRIVTRKSPNLECGFFAGLLEYLERARVGLGITKGEITWEFISTATEEIAVDDETICFNVGGGIFDQHGHPDNRSLCELCSIYLVHKEYPFTERRPWLREVYQLVRDNDVFGKRISRHPFNMREIMSGLAIAKEDDPQLVLEWLSFAFCGVFENLKDGVSIKKVFDPQVLVQGVESYDAERSDWFQKYLQLGVGVIKNHTKWANGAVAKAEELGKTAKVYVPSINAEVHVIEVWCDSIKTAAIARGKGYQIVIQWNKDGHCQIHGGNVREGDVKKWLDLGVVARDLRLCEAKFRGKRIASGQDWAGSGSVLFGDGYKVPWYLPEFRTSVYNGTLSSRDLEPTRFKPAKLFSVVLDALVSCEAIIQEGDGDRQKEESQLNVGLEDLSKVEF